MRARRANSRRRPCSGATWFLATLAWSVARAQTVPPIQKPVGIDNGSVVFAPSLTVGYGYDSNLFLQTDFAAQSDRVLTVQPAFVLSVPFSNSAFHLGDTLRYTDYAVVAQDHKNANEIYADTELHFGSLDTMKFAGRLTSGAADTIKFDPGGSIASLHGSPFRLDTEEASIAREIDGARGYRVAVTRNNFSCPTLSFLDYKGYDGEAAYIQPLSSSARFTLSYIGTTYDHLCSTTVEQGDGTSLVTDVPCNEQGHTAYGELEGLLGSRQPYKIRLGWERLTFAGSQGADYNGIIGLADLSALVGGGTSIQLELQRQPYRSQFANNNYYLFAQASLRVDHAFPRRTSLGGVISLTNNVYPDPVELPALPGEIAASVYPRDRTVAAEIYASLPIVERCAFRLSIRDSVRTSNYPGRDYSQLAIGGGVVIGWF